MDSNAQSLHAEAIIIDAVCPLLQRHEFLSEYQAGGLTAVAPTVGGWYNAEKTMRDIGAWHRMLRERDDLMLIRSAADVRAAKAAGKTGIILHFQGTEPLEDDLDLIDAYKALGVGVIQLAYNTKNRIGDGCEERTDAGLSRYGLKVIERLNATKVIIDCSHTGYRTTMDAIEHSSAPVIISHANAKAVHASPRNIGDDLIKAIARNGGTVGVVGFPAFVSSSPRPTIDAFINHIAYLCDLIGSDKVTLGIDYFHAQHPYADEVQGRRIYDELVAEGSWSTASYPPPPYFYPAGIETPRSLPALTQAMLGRGFSTADIKMIYGENLLHIYKAVWGK